jgi:plasmid stabilization system protein ParE
MTPFAASWANGLPVQSWKLPRAIAVMPLRFALVDKGRRRTGVRWFPYGLFFLVEESPVVVIACFHGKRDPKRWQQRES